MNNINNLRPFPRFCVTIGMLPTSYKESMTYEEQLLWLCRYLETEVIPKYNENVEAINQLITLYNQLKEYVDNYFENLDVQEEINNKLDEMAESGELAEIITAYLQINGVLAFDSISDLEAATNIIEGSSCYILGENSYNDGKGAYYKIRTKTESDVVDHYNIVETPDNTLVGERLPNYYLNQINENIEELESNIIYDKVSNFSNYFGFSNITLLSETGYKVIEPFVVFDKENNKYIMYYSSTKNGLFVKRAESTNLVNWTTTSQNILDGSSTARHKFAVLVDVCGNPVKINNKYHGYVVSSTPKKIYHWETTSLLNQWTETGVAIDAGLDGTVDDFGVDAPYAIYDNINKKVIIYYMGLKSTGNYKSTINRATSNNPRNGFTFEDTILEPEVNSWFAGWLGGLQVLNTENELKVIFNGSPTNPLGPGSEPDPSAIGIGTMDSLYSRIQAPKTPTLQLNTSMPNNINTGSIWRGFVIYNKFINNYMMFYNTGGASYDEIISYALNGYYRNYEETQRFLTTTDEDIISGTEQYLDLPNIYKIKISARCGINGSSGMKVFRIKLKVSQDKTLGNIAYDDITLMSRDVFIGNYAYQNENVDVEVINFLNDPKYCRVYASVELIEGTIPTTDKPYLSHVQFTIETK